MNNYPIWKISIIFIIVILAIIFTIPTFFFKSDESNWFYEKQINLGLDLQGGSHLLLEVKNDKLIEEEINNIIGFIRQFSRNKKIQLESLSSQKEIIKVILNNELDTKKLIEYQNINFPELLISKNDNVLIMEFSPNYKKRLYESAVNQSLEIVRKRIDESGTKEPLIQRQGSSRIVLQLPGVKDPERIKTLLG